MGDLFGRMGGHTVDKHGDLAWYETVPFRER
jgi:hypothetical protein